MASVARCLSERGGGRNDDVSRVVEGDNTEDIGGIELRDNSGERLACTVERGTGHGTTSVEHDLERVRSSVRDGAGGCLQFEQHGHLVRGFVGDDINIERSREFHVSSFLQLVSTKGHLQLRRRRRDTVCTCDGGTG